jgi:CrcB protein
MSVLALPPLTATLLVASGGALGAVGRYWTGRLMLHPFGSAWPWGTLTVNIVGGLLMGLVVGWGAFRSGLGQGPTLFLTTGVLGGFTTFSAFSLEVMGMIERGAWAQAALYALASVVLAVAALAAGLTLVRATS